MQVTNELLREFIGGQVESRNWRYGGLTRGEVVEAAVLRDGMVVIRCTWSAEAEGYPSGAMLQEGSVIPPQQVRLWTMLSGDQLTSTVSLDDYHASLVQTPEGERLVLAHAFTSHTITLMRPDEPNKLDRNVVLNETPDDQAARRKTEADAALKEIMDTKLPAAIQRARDDDREQTVLQIPVELEEGFIAACEARGYGVTVYSVSSLQRAFSSDVGVKLPPQVEEQPGDT